MSSDDRQQFMDDLAMRFDDLAVWAISHWPDRQHPLTHMHFAAVRKAMLDVATVAGARTAGADSDGLAPAPSAGGPQYTNSDPAPWP